MTSIPEKRSYSSPLSLFEVFKSLGLILAKPVDRVPRDIDIDTILALKLTNPQIAKSLGASDVTVEIVRAVELTANILDSYSESGDVGYLQEADRMYTETLLKLSSSVRKEVILRSAAALTYFHHEAAVALRIKRGEQFLQEEVVEYLLRRGSDSLIYEGLLKRDGIWSPGLAAGFRVRQALWDLEDDVRDLEEDKRTIGANVLLLFTNSTYDIGNLASSLLNQARQLEIPNPLLEAIEDQYELTSSALA
ncbi:hypothetical protein A3F34_00465 [Candidatus Roizmanbacteria bacterium RIFCSPHIGHO2_12_FULL_44_10]|uniref:Uncharacterized protein n=1 Tax=Candidatus Roizmanbacteria bacterium RIFCSPHIGHO2_12_FULL_44_10 TaxID=1802054 RepID=A0A1F7I668_9BACT|nr:MAG: hypothetical protein A3F34_00465 [Candidatus Roizmanbacteria bacterium RIFCSPHIGHO2_12_FULL_44_10]